MMTGEQIRTARKRAGLSQGDLATLVGVSMRTVGNWEREDSAPGIAEPRLISALRDYLDNGPVSAGPLQAVSDVELLAEIARRFARAERRERGEDGGDTAATKAPGPGPVTPIRPRELPTAARDIGQPSRGQRDRAAADRAGEPPADDPNDMEPR